MASTMNSPLRYVLEQWCGEGSLEGTSFMKQDVGDTCFIWVEPVTQGNNTLFPSYFSSPSELRQALENEPQRQISEAIISTPTDYLRLLADTANLDTPDQQHCFVIHKKRALEEAENKKVLYSQQELDARFSQQTKNKNPALNKQQWSFEQQGSALFFIGEVEGGE